MKKCKFALGIASALALTVISSDAAITLGDIAIIGMGSDTGIKRLDFVALNDLNAGDTITFTDSGWVTDPSGAFRGSEGGAIYTVPVGGISAGTIISATGTSGTTWAANTNWSSGDDALVGTNGMNFSTSGDGILAFTGSSSSPTFIFALSGPAFVASATSSSNTAVPTGLTEGVNAVSSGDFDNIYYSGPTSFLSATAALAAIANSANWSGDNATYTPVTTFSIIPEPSAALLGAVGLLGLLRRRR